MDTSRNIGLISREQQRALKRASILVAGCGGMGGVCAEVLVRLGVEKLVLVDPDRFEKSNSNRQIHCNQKSVGKLKAKVLEKEFLKINPRLKVRAFPEAVSLENVKSLLKGVDIVVNGMDQMFPSICLEREARRKGIPIVDAWLTPFASVFTMKPSDPHWEEFLKFPTRKKAESEITAHDCAKALQKEVNYTLGHFDPFTYVQPKLAKKVIEGKAKRPSLAPVVWMSGVLMANEVFKMVLGMKVVGPAGIFYDHYQHRMTKGRIQRPQSKAASRAVVRLE